MTFRHLTRLEVPGSAIVACPHSIRQLVNLQVRLDPWGLVTCGRKLGEGASGEVFIARIVATGEVLAAKIFRADVSPDGRTVEEVAIACAVDHPNLTRVRAVVALAPPAPAPATPPAAAPEPAPMLLMDLVPGQPLAAKPTSQHLLRCNHVITMVPGVMVVLALRWRPDTQFSLQQVLAIGTALSSALAYLHARCICHGDVYAHNVLWSPATAGCPGLDRITLCDFGASFSYKEGEWFWQAME
ncbi:protein kinase domain-containing protein, partial [Haematococcus lacustris]